MARISQVDRFVSSTFRGTTPSYVVPNDISAVWDQIGDRFGKMADEEVAQEKYKQGVAEQTAQASTTPLRNIAGDARGFGIASKAFAKGANDAFKLQKQAELDTAFTQYQQKHQNNVEAFKTDWNTNFLPQFLTTIPTNMQATFRLETTERFNRVTAGMTEKNLRIQDQRNQATQAAQIDNITNQISLMVASGSNYDQNTGKTLTNLLKDAASAITELDVTHPKLAIAANAKLQQQLRSAEYRRHFNTLNEKQKEEFLNAMRSQTFNGSKMRGETLSPEKRSQIVYELQRLHNATKTNNKAETARLKSELRATEMALLSGVGGERDLEPLLQQTSSLLPDDSDQWRERLSRAQGFAKEVTAINALPVPLQTKREKEFEQQYLAAKQQYDKNQITSSEFAWQQARYEGVAKMVAARKNRINQDVWSMLNEPEAPTFDLNTADGVYEARNWLANKTGIAIYSIPPMSKQRIEAHRTDILEQPDSVQRAAKIQQLRQQLGDNQFRDAFTLMKLDEAYMSVAFATNPQMGANILNTLEEGSALEKRADKTLKDSINKSFDNQLGKALNFDVSKREQLRDAYMRMYLAYQSRGVAKPNESAFQAITTGQKIITLTNGEKRLVPLAIDEQQVRNAIADVKEKWQTLGIILPPNMTYNDVSIDSFSPQIVGNKLMFFSPNKIPVKIRGRNTDKTEILQIDLGTYKIATDNEYPQTTSVWNGVTFAAPSTDKTSFMKTVVPKGYSDANAFLDKLYLDNKDALTAADNVDLAARYISSKPYEQQRLQAFVAVIRKGELPDWGMEFINQFDLLKVRYQPDFDDLKKRWREHNKQQILPGGATATPLELLMTLVKQVRQTPYNTGYARRNQLRR